MQAYHTEEGSAMYGQYENIYKTTRRKAGYTQEAAAERLGISVESVRAYETGQRIPPNHIVDLMSILYHSQQLAYLHLHESNVLIEHVIPELEQRSLMAVAMRIYNRINRFSQTHRLERLMEIAEDDRIDETERAEFDLIMLDIREIIKSGLEMDVFCAHSTPGT